MTNITLVGIHREDIACLYLWSHVGNQFNANAAET